MISTRPILAATDFSAHARHAVERAARLAHEKAAPLGLVHVLPGETLARLRDRPGKGVADVAVSTAHEA